jgi:putative DNA primase/helicase
MNGPTETPQEAARRLAAPAIRDGYEPEALHTYTDPDGTPLHWRIRLRHPETREKWIRPMRLNGVGFELGEPEYPDGKPLYGLDKLAARPHDPVIVAEGEWCGRRADESWRAGHYKRRRRFRGEG